MRRVLVNLVENATQAISEKGQPLLGEVTLSSERMDGGIEIAVTDDGPGIPQELREKVFEPLFSTKSFGVGLGLTIVKQIVEQHDGRVLLESGAGGGGRVGLRFASPTAQP